MGFRFFNNVRVDYHVGCGKAARGFEALDIDQAQVGFTGDQRQGPVGILVEGRMKILRQMIDPGNIHAANGLGHRPALALRAHFTDSREM